MALNKEITSKQGVVSTYHKITAYAGINDGERSIVNVTVRSYVSQEKRNENVDYHCSERDFPVTVTTYELDSIPVLTLLYNKLKDKSFFAYATDC